MNISRRSSSPVVMARMVSHQGGAAASSRAAEREARTRMADADPTREPSYDDVLAERTSFFESSYELHAGLDVMESSWSEALDVCPDSGWPPLPPLPPPRGRPPR
jgi:hypothetical protein